MIPKPDSVLRAPWLYDVQPFHMVDNVYYVGNRSVSVHLFDTGDGLLLLDSGYSQTAYLLLESIRELGFDPHDLRWIIHTHGHYDHFGATRMLQEKYGCSTFMPAIDIPMLNERAQLNYCAVHDLPYEPPYDLWFQVDTAIHPGDVLTFGNTKMRAYAAPGHTPGTMAYVFELPSGYKAAMHGGIGLNTLTSEYAKLHDLGNTWRKAFAGTLDQLTDLEVDVVLGNHPKQSDTFGKHSRQTADFDPFVDPTEWKRLLETTREKFLAMVKKDPI